jgi:uncharacterized protein (TIRG00374 family)
MRTPSGLYAAPAGRVVAGVAGPSGDHSCWGGCLNVAWSCANMAIDVSDHASTERLGAASGAAAGVAAAPASPEPDHGPAVMIDDRDGEEDSPPPADPAPAPGEGRSQRRRGLRGLLPAPIWQVGRLLFLALIIEYLVVPQLAGPRKVAHLLTQVNPFLLLAGVGLEAGALVCYAQLTRTVLPGGDKLGLGTLQRIQLSTLSVSHCAPGGSATGTALGYRLMTQAGVPRSDVGFALAMQGIGSAVVLNVILWLALIVSIPVWGFSPVYLTAAGVGVVLLGLAGVLMFLLTRGEQWVGMRLERMTSRLPFVDGTAVRRFFEQVAARLQEVGQQRRVLLRAFLWAGANWLLDAASLAVFLGAFGHWVNPDDLLVAYGLANVLAVIPITPGGLGVVEATLTSVLVGFGTPRGVAITGVIVYRLVNFWLPIPLGGLAYLSLQVNPGGSLERGEHARRSPPRWLTWPGRSGGGRLHRGSST